MRKMVLLLGATISTFYMFSQEITETKIKSKIDKVTVFVTGGEVSRTSTVNVKKGRNKLIFTGISTVADNKSVQFAADGPFNLVSVSSEIDYLSFGTTNGRIKTVKDSLDLLRNQIVDMQNERSAYVDEKELLKKNNSIKGEQENLSVEELKAMAEYYRTRMMELNKILTKYDRDIQANQGLVYRYQNQLTELNYKETAKSNQIIVIIDSESAQSLNVDLKYVVSNCGWQANYDLKASDVNGEINLNYKAKVYNNTGNDWKDVNMVLSTSDPNISASAPILSPWYLSYGSLQNVNDFNNDQGGYVVPQNRAYKQYYQNASAPTINGNLDGLTYEGNGNWQDGWNTPTITNPTVSFTTIEVSELSREFKIEKTYSIPSDSKPYLVEIAKHDLAASFSYKAVPKLDKDAFLLGNIVGWEELDLLPGPTNVYFANTYVGQSYINTRNVTDTLRLSFGRDKKLIIDRKLLEEYSDKKVVGSNRKDSYLYEITVKNTRTTPVKLTLFDQVPISQDSDISVTVDETSSAEYSETTGRLMWRVNLEPGESQKYKIGFTIKYPKDKQISVKRYKTISCPSF